MHVGVATNHTNFAPRVGFSASVRPGTVVRGGYGISYYPISTALTGNQNPPYAYSNNCVPCFGWWPNLPVPTPSSTTNLSGSLTAVSRNYNTSSVQQFNLMVQQQFGANVFTLGGVGELGLGTPFSSSTINLPYPNGPYANDATTGPYYCASSAFDGDFAAEREHDRVSKRGCDQQLLRPAGRSSPAGSPAVSSSMSTTPGRTIWAMDPRMATAGEMPSA